MNADDPFDLHEAWNSNEVRFASDEDGDLHLAALTDAGNPASWTVEEIKAERRERIDCSQAWFPGLPSGTAQAWCIEFARSFRVTTSTGQWLEFAGGGRSSRLIGHGDATYAVAIEPTWVPLNNDDDYYEIDGGAVLARVRSENDGNVETFDPRTGGWNADVDKIIRLDQGRPVDMFRAGQIRDSIVAAYRAGVGSKE